MGKWFNQSIRYIHNYDRGLLHSYFQEVLSKADTSEIQLNKDGSWSTNTTGSDSHSLDTPCKKYQSYDISDEPGK